MTTAETDEQTSGQTDSQTENERCRDAVALRIVNGDAMHDKVSVYKPRSKQKTTKLNDGRSQRLMLSGS